MGATSRLMVEITAQSRQLEKELHQASRSVDSFGQSLRKALTVAAHVPLARRKVNDGARGYPKHRRYRRHLTKNRG